MVSPKTGCPGARPRPGCTGAYRLWGLHGFPAAMGFAWRGLGGAGEAVVAAVCLRGHDVCAVTCSCGHGVRAVRGSCGHGGSRGGGRRSYGHVSVWRGGVPVAMCSRGPVCSCGHGVRAGPRSCGHVFLPCTCQARVGGVAYGMPFSRGCMGVVSQPASPPARLLASPAQPFGEGLDHRPVARKRHLFPVLQRGRAPRPRSESPGERNLGQAPPGRAADLGSASAMGWAHEAAPDRPAPARRAVRTVAPAADGPADPVLGHSHHAALRARSIGVRRGSRSIGLPAVQVFRCSGSAQAAHS